jgi:hypothetical protein
MPLSSPLTHNYQQLKHQTPHLTALPSYLLHTIGNLLLHTLALPSSLPLLPHIPYCSTTTTHIAYTKAEQLCQCPSTPPSPPSSPFPLICPTCTCLRNSICQLQPSTANTSCSHHCPSCMTACTSTQPQSPTPCSPCIIIALVTQRSTPYGGLNSSCPSKFPSQPSRTPQHTQHHH